MQCALELEICLGVKYPPPQLLPGQGLTGKYDKDSCIGFKFVTYQVLIHVVIN